MRLVISADEAAGWIRFLVSQGKPLPEWARDWDGVSSVWLEEVNQ
jgi:hypothetical protein